MEGLAEGAVENALEAEFEGEEAAVGEFPDLADVAVDDVAAAQQAAMAAADDEVEQFALAVAMQGL